MKDARGHGSEGRGGDSAINDRLKRPRIGMTTDAVFSNRRGVGDRTDTQRTVANLRTRMQNTGPGYQAGLSQSIKNFLGG
jgi:hypothetical protein